MRIVIDVVHGSSSMEIGIKNVKSSENKSWKTKEVNANFIEWHENNGCKYYRSHAAGRTKRVISWIGSLFKVSRQIRNDNADQVQRDEVKSSLCSKNHAENIFYDRAEEIQGDH